jgi:hypothetical protein
MRLIAASLFALALAVPTVAGAGPGVNLRWDQCYGDSGAANKLFACDTNTGAERLVVSYELPADLPSVSGAEISIYIEAASATLPDWWQYKNVGSCRLTALTFSPALPPGSANCADWGQGGASGGLGAYTLEAPARAVLKAATAVPPSGLHDLFAGTEYFAAAFQISHVKTVGTGACGGCDVPVCIVLGQVNVVTPVLANNILMVNGANGQASQVASWQSATTLNLVNGCHMACTTTFDCVATITPTRTSTWGAVKALYR